MLPFLHVFLGLLSLHMASCCAAMDTVSPGNGIAGSDRLVSNNSKFALGFFKMDSKLPHAYLGIWFHKVPTITPVWSANGESPVIDPVSPELIIAGDGNLAILDRATKKVIWSTHAHANVTTTNTIAVLMNNGNFVLQSSSNPSNIFWQSFDYPTDTLFAGAKLGWDRTTGLNRRLVSRKNLIDQAPGLYTLEIGKDGAGHIWWNSTVSFWNSGEWKGRYFNRLPEMIGSTSNFTFVSTENESYFMYSLRNDTKIVRYSVDVYGQGVVGAWLQEEPEPNWLFNYRQPILKCDVYATCGPFTICKENADPLCSCIRGFSLGSPTDWDLGDRRHGCRRNTQLHCKSEGNRTGLADKFYPMQGLRQPDDGTNLQGPAAISGDDCRKICLGNCSCNAYSYGKGGCSVWHGNLYNVKQQSDASSAANGDIFYIRLAAMELPESVVSKKKRTIKVSAAAGGASAVALVLMILGLLIWRNKGKRISSSLENAQGGVGIISFRYADLQRATNNFAERLGGGSFGSVFKGYLSDSVTLGVKRLDHANEGEKQFRAEVSSVGIIQHINLVKLIGFCCEGDKRLLVYEFMPNQSLELHLFKSNNGTVLAWNLRYQIAIGVARGLAYLHTGCRDCIIHCDIKPENILLDTSFVAKIADFGMAKILGREFSQAVTTMRGTIGYLAPEWISGSAVTSKVDVYSYGMVLFEIISGRKNASHEYSGDSDYSVFFPLHVARKLLREESVGNLVDPNLHGDVNLEEVERVCKVACWCIQDNEFDRPTMAEVLQFLEGVIEVDMPPVPRLLNAITTSSVLPTPL